MNIQMLTEWVAALRSNDYVQGNLALKRINGSLVSFCCLGVVQDLYAKKFPDEYEWGGTTFIGKTSGGIQTSSLLNDISKDLLGRCENRTGDIYSLYGRRERGRGGNPVSLMELNDDGFTFSQIADMIEYFFLKPALREQESELAKVL
jgi:hypothetical protein